MPRVQPRFLFSVFYLYPSEQDALDNSEEGATGFFFGEKSEVSPNFPHLYAVTNRHVVFRKGMEQPVLRINTKDGKFKTFPTDRSDWRPHRDGDDIAICPVYFDISLHAIEFFERGFITDDKFIKDFNVGAGDDVVMIGRFRTYAGKSKNLPTVRFGNISAMNEEKVHNPFTGLTQESYIVEMRSMSGYSGSPVLLHIPYMSFRWTHPPSHPEDTNFVTGASYTSLLGINWGQIVYKEKAKDQYDQELIIEMDSSMAGVVPIYKLMDLIDSEELVEMRKKKDGGAIQG